MDGRLAFNADGCGIRLVVEQEWVDIGLGLVELDVADEDCDGNRQQNGEGINLHRICGCVFSRRGEMAGRDRQGEDEDGMEDGMMRKKKSEIVFWGAEKNVPPVASNQSRMGQSLSCSGKFGGRMMSSGSRYPGKLLS